jgi:hypothetical protein
VPPVLKPLSRPQLVARIETLRDEKEQLLREKADLKKKLEASSGESVARSYSRMSPEELAASAKKGELRVRLNFSDSEYRVNKKVAERVGLTSAEEAALKKLYSDAAERVHAGLLKAYGQMGGDVNSALSFTTMALVEELRSKSLKGEFEDAIRQLANERAGLVPPSQPSTSSTVLNAFRHLWNEDDRIVNEIEALLGPARAEEYLNDKNGDHSDHVWGVGAMAAPLLSNHSFTVCLRFSE